jgi:hypothetical protein
MALALLFFILGNLRLNRKYNFLAAGRSVLTDASSFAGNPSSGSARITDIIHAARWAGWQYLSSTQRASAAFFSFKWEGLYGWVFLAGQIAQNSCRDKPLLNKRIFG